MNDEVVLIGAIIVSFILLHGLYDISERLYWKFIDWRASREKDC
jgi:hypothetical protein